MPSRESTTRPPHPGLSLDWSRSWQESFDDVAHRADQVLRGGGVTSFTRPGPRLPAPLGRQGKRVVARGWVPRGRRKARVREHRGQRGRVGRDRARDAASRHARSGGHPLVGDPAHPRRLERLRTTLSAEPWGGIHLLFDLGLKLRQRGLFRDSKSPMRLPRAGSLVGGVGLGQTVLGTARRCCSTAPGRSDRPAPCADRPGTPRATC